MKKIYHLIFLIFTPLFLFGQSENSLNNSSYLLDKNQAKFLILNKNDEILFKGDFKNDIFKSKEYLFKEGVIYHKKDSIGFYSDKKIYFSNMEFKFKRPLFKENIIKNMTTKKKMCNIAEDNFKINVQFKNDNEDKLTTNLLTCWSIIMKIQKNLEKRTNNCDYFIGFAVGSAVGK